ncbi:MAG TPA: glycosyltransferase family 4 protein [Candidatus Micrarchaeaceae archaeon]|nr:glycosyltransferase family 4 protein [Candidatus Micrarchaeaceae archaeon]
MTFPTADEATPAPLRVAWFGHAVGARADGLTTYSADVVSGLLDQGAEVWFHHASRDGRITPVDEAHRIGWPTWRFKTVTVPRWGFRPQLSRWLDRHRPDVVHASLSFTLEDGWLGRQARRSGAATVATFHLPFGRPGSGRATTMRELHRFWAPRLRAYQRVIVFSEDHRGRLAELGVEPSRIEVLPNAVDTERFCPGSSPLRQERLGSASLVVGYLGRLDREKGIRELLDGFARADLGPDARLLLAGGGALRGRVIEAQRDPRVIYLGQLQTPRERQEFWRAVDIFCLPSSAEGLSIALLEAMASGCAVATTRAGGADSVGGVATELDSADVSGSIAAVLDELGRRPEERARHGQMAREQAVRHHGLTGMLDRLQSIYRDCQPRPSGNRLSAD